MIIYAQISKRNLHNKHAHTYTANFHMRRFLTRTDVR